MNIQKNISKLSNLIKLDLNYFIVNGFWIYSAYILSLVTGLILTFFYANYLDKEIYGKYIFVLSLFSLLGIFSLPGMGQALTLSLLKGFSGNFRKSIKLTLYFSILGALILIGFTIFYYFQSKIDISAGILILAALFPLLSFSTYYFSFLAASKNFKKISIINAINFTSTCILVILAILYFPSVASLIAASLGTQLPLNLFFTFKYWGKQKNPKVNKQYLNSGIHLSITAAISFLSKSVDKFIIGLMLPIQDLAFYAIALLFPDQFFGFIRQIVPLLLPKIADLRQKDHKKIIFKVFLLTESVMLTLVLGYFLVSPLIFKIFLPKYLDAIYLTQIYSLILITLPTFLFSLIFQKLKKNKYFYFQEITFTGSLIILLLLLVPIFGIKGAIFAQVISKFIYLFISLILFVTLK